MNRLKEYIQQLEMEKEYQKGTLESLASFEELELALESIDEEIDFLLSEESFFEISEEGLPTIKERGDINLRMSGDRHELLGKYIKGFEYIKTLFKDKKGIIKQYKSKLEKVEQTLKRRDLPKEIEFHYIAIEKFWTTPKGRYPKDLVKELEQDFKDTSTFHKPLCDSFEQDIKVIEKALDHYEKDKIKTTLSKLKYLDGVMGGKVVNQNDNYFYRTLFVYGLNKDKVNEDHRNDILFSTYGSVVFKILSGSFKMDVIDNLKSELGAGLVGAGIGSLPFGTLTTAVAALGTGGAIGYRRSLKIDKADVHTISSSDIFKVIDLGYDYLENSLELLDDVEKTFEDCLQITEKIVRKVATDAEKYGEGGLNAREMEHFMTFIQFSYLKILKVVMKELPTRQINMGKAVRFLAVRFSE